MYIALAYFYCDFRDSRTQDPFNILGELARQLVSQDEHCFAEYTQKHSNNDATLRNHTLKELCDLIRETSTYFKTTMIIVDGLDEIDNDRVKVINLLKSLNAPYSSIKTLFVSRYEVDIKYELQDYIRIGVAATSVDLKLYIASEIERRTRQKKLRFKDPSLKEHILKTLVASAGGMYVHVYTSFVIKSLHAKRFLWVACQVDYLCDCSTDRERRDALKKNAAKSGRFIRADSRTNKSKYKGKSRVIEESPSLDCLCYRTDSYTAVISGPRHSR